MHTIHKERFEAWLLNQPDGRRFVMMSIHECIGACYLRDQGHHSSSFGWEVYNIGLQNFEAPAWLSSFLLRFYGALHTSDTILAAHAKSVWHKMYPETEVTIPLYTPPPKKRELKDAAIAVLTVATILALLFLSTGCSHTREFARQTLDDGTKSDWVTVQETAFGFGSPSIKRMFRLNKRTGEEQEIAIASGNGATGNTIQAAGTAFGLREIGRGLRHSGDRTTVNQSGASSEAGSSSTSDSDATAEASSNSSATADAEAAAKKHIHHNSDSFIGPRQW